MNEIHVLVSARLTEEQLTALATVDPRIVIHGGPGGIALLPAAGTDLQEMAYPDWHPEIDLDALLKKIEVIIAFRVPDDVQGRAPNLKWVQYSSAGIDHVWTEKLAASDLIFTTISGVHPIPMAEFDISMMLFFAKRWLRLLDQQRRRVWDKFLMDKLYGRTLGVVGFGKIGRESARRAHAFGMRLLYHDARRAPESVEKELEARFVSLDELLRESDYVAVHTPLTPQTRHLFDAAAFKKMKPTAIFLNASRGQVVDEEALIWALQNQVIAGAGLDVFAREPLPPDSPLWEMPNVILSPHMAGDTPLYMERATAIFCENLRRYAAGERLLNVVDHKAGF